MFSKDADQDRAFLRDVLQFRSVNAGHGWLIFALPPSEMAVHPGAAAEKPQAEPGMAEVAFYLMCDNLDATIDSLRERGIKYHPIDMERWGRKTTIQLPSGAWIGLYQPLHPLAIDVAGA
jgi:predicted enzyme related to lactoylglutathione lyase